MISSYLHSANQSIINSEVVSQIDSEEELDVIESADKLSLYERVNNINNMTMLNSEVAAVGEL